MYYIISFEESLHCPGWVSSVRGVGWSFAYPIYNTLLRSLKFVRFPWRICKSAVIMPRPLQLETCLFHIPQNDIHLRWPFFILRGSFTSHNFNNNIPYELCKLPWFIFQPDSIEILNKNQMFLFKQKKRNII